MFVSAEPVFVSAEPVFVSAEPGFVSAEPFFFVTPAECLLLRYDGVSLGLLHQRSIYLFAMTVSAWVCHTSGVSTSSL